MVNYLARKSVAWPSSWVSMWEKESTCRRKGVKEEGVNEEGGEGGRSE